MGVAICPIVCKTRMRSGLKQVAASFESDAQAILESFLILVVLFHEEPERLKERLEKNRKTERNLKTGMQV
jgi:hypothetical protein